MEIPQSQTKCSLYNSISGATTDLITVHLVYTVLVFIGGAWGRHVPPPPKKNMPPKSFTGYIMI